MAQKHPSVRVPLSNWSKRSVNTLLGADLNPGKLVANKVKSHDTNILQVNLKFKRLIQSVNFRSFRIFYFGILLQTIEYCKKMPI